MDGRRPGRMIFFVQIQSCINAHPCVCLLLLQGQQCAGSFESIFILWTTHTKSIRLVINPVSIYIMSSSSMRPVPPRPSSLANIASNEPPPLPRRATPPPTALLLLPAINGSRSVVLPALCLPRIVASTAAAAEGVLCSGVACLAPDDMPTMPLKPCMKPVPPCLAAAASSEVGGAPRGRRSPLSRSLGAALDVHEEDTCPICSAARARVAAVRPAAPGCWKRSSPSPTVPPLSGVVNERGSTGQHGNRQLEYTLLI